MRGKPGEWHQGTMEQGSSVPVQVKTRLERDHCIQRGLASLWQHECERE